MNHVDTSAIVTFNELQLVLSPETDLERTLLRQPELLLGMAWGKPRYGHPEGEIWKHVRDVFGFIDRLPIDQGVREKLRLIAIVHDTFKYKEHRGNPRDWSKHHSVFARKFAEQFIEDPILLNIIELHDEAYYIWRLRALHNRFTDADVRLNALLNRIRPEEQLYYLFFKCDTSTGDKNPAPLYWFEAEFPGIEIVNFR